MFPTTQLHECAMRAPVRVVECGAARRRQTGQRLQDRVGVDALRMVGDGDEKEKSDGAELHLCVVFVVVKSDA